MQQQIESNNKTTLLYEQTYKHHNSGKEHKQTQANNQATAKPPNQKANHKAKPNKTTTSNKHIQAKPQRQTQQSY